MAIFRVIILSEEDQKFGGLKMRGSFQGGLKKLLGSNDNHDSHPASSVNNQNKNYNLMGALQHLQG